MPRTGLVGALLVTCVLAIAVIGPFATPHSPTEFVGDTFAQPSASAWLGTDAVGRDVFSRVLCGGYRILGLALLATVLGVMVGVLLGVSAGYAKGAVDEIIMRGADVVMAFPQTILVLLVVSIVGPSPFLITVVLALIHAPQVTRVARAATLRIAQEDFVLYAESLGTPLVALILREIVPNITAPISVEFGLKLAYSVTLMAGLSFLGFGAQPPAADWGLMISENRIGLLNNPYPVVSPIVMIAMLTIGLNLLVDALNQTAGKPARLAAKPPPIPLDVALPKAILKPGS